MVTPHEAQFEYVDIGKLVEDPTNPNVMGEQEEKAVKENIKEFGFLVPVVINDSYHVADGEHRIKIARELGYQKIPCIKSSKLNDDIARRIVRQSLNKIRGEHDSIKDLSELEMIFSSQFNNAANILQKVALVGKGQYEEMKRLISNSGVRMYEHPAYKTEVGDDGRKYDMDQTAHKANMYLQNQIKQIILFYTASDYEKIVTRLDNMGKEMKVSNNTDIMNKLLDHYENCPNK